jgi:hypothetical protein
VNHVHHRLWDDVIDYRLIDHWDLPRAVAGGPPHSHRPAVGVAVVVPGISCPAKSCLAPMMARATRAKSNRKSNRCLCRRACQEGAGADEAKNKKGKYFFHKINHYLEGQNHIIPRGAFIQYQTIFTKII